MKSKTLEPDSSNCEFTFDNLSFEVDFTKIELLSQRIQTLLGVQDFQLSIDFISPEEMRRLNSEFRGKDQTTDVLSFPQFEFTNNVTCEAPFNLEATDGPPVLLGDIAISLVDANKNAQSIGQDLDREVCFLLVHGILHLCGHDHIKPDEEKVMVSQQKKIMENLEDNEPPPSPWMNCARLRHKQ